ncbi:MAG: hypothetical protein DMF90_04750 [Acidobacteria bacterium]|nr:MAG: hypothetical protein DMF90_04750 [Acidobacteriota bacterium]
MSRARVAVVLVVATLPGVLRPVVHAQTADLAGLWALNRELSQFPREVGFGLAGLSPEVGGTNPAPSGGRSRRGSGGSGGAFRPPLPESEDDARRRQQVTEEVRNPPALLTITETASAVTITNERGRVRTLRTDGKEGALQLDGGAPIGVIAKREAGRLVVQYRVDRARELRYTFQRVASPPQLVVEVEFIEQGAGDRVRRVYEPAGPADVAAATAAAAASSDTAATARNAAASPAGIQAAGTGPTGGTSPTGGGGQAAAPSTAPAQTGPDAELKGLTRLGVVVEDPGPQAAACGVIQKTIESAVSKRLTDAGFRILRNTSEDTYVYINVITTSPSNGFCVSRYDAFVYSYTTAKLTYQATPALVQVSLLHKGGITGGASSQHGDAVLRGILEYIDQFSTRIRDANK